MNSIALTITAMGQDALHRGLESTLTLCSPREKRQAEYILSHQDVVAWCVTDAYVVVYPIVRSIETYVA